MSSPSTTTIVKTITPIIIRMDIMREFADSIDRVAMKTDNSVDMIALMTEAKKWRLLQNAIEKELLRPKRSEG